MKTSYKVPVIRSCEGAYIERFDSPEALAKEVMSFVQEAERLVAVRRHKHKRKYAGRIQNPVILSAGGAPWFWIGSGLYGEAWRHVDYPNLVVKISGHEGWGWHDFLHEKCPSRDAYPVYAALCATTEHPNLPEILYSGKAGGIRWYVMPRYDAWDSALHGDVCPVTGVTYNTLRIALEDVEAHNQDWGYYNVFEHVARLRETHGFNVDLHSANMMVNPINGAFIVTDPYSHCTSSSTCWYSSTNGFYSDCEHYSASGT